jgi:phosphoglycolate phosphatase-like HAD superfamily hydrolase
MIRAIIFDYDGVIAESVHVKTDAFAELYSSYGTEIVQKVVDHHEAHGGISRFEKFKIYHESFLGIKLDDKGVARLAQQFSELVLTKVIESPYIAGAYEFLKNNHTNFDLFISTGTPEDEIKTILKEKNIFHYFKGIYGSPSSKVSHIQAIMGKYPYEKSEYVFIGDALTDRDAARTVGIEFIGRYTTIAEIKQEKLLIEDFNSLMGIIKKL